MKCLLLFVPLFTLAATRVYAHPVPVRRTRVVAGVSAPELIHAGVTYRLAEISQVGISVGAGPSFGSIWPTINLEHRLYFGPASEKSNQKAWFFRQGTTFFPSEEPGRKFTLNLTVGKDISFKNGKSGITIDGGAFYLPESQESSVLLVRSLNLWPALRFEAYF